MASAPARTARGAAAGALAAGVWALQEPLDQRAFGVAYSDVALLGRWVTRGRTWPAAGLALHVANGAAFGAVYAAVRRRLPLPPALRGPAAGLAEHLATWPLVGLVDRHHPARDEMPRLAGSARALAQATWRHLLFGFVLGEIERRLNAEDGDDDGGITYVVSSNGHGDIAHAMTRGAA
ncbi:MAG TPA: hypothetical protein VFT50_06170 [Baekduia sp.]|nr:hypothetical protein [Baekduia sp.]